jgi:hypothetical protein
MTDSYAPLVVDGDEIETLVGCGPPSGTPRSPGHADLLREAVDGLVGEDAPQ